VLGLLLRSFLGFLAALAQAGITLPDCGLDFLLLVGVPCCATRALAFRACALSGMGYLRFPGSANDLFFSFLRSLVLLRSLAMTSVLPGTGAEISARARSSGAQLLGATGGRRIIDDLDRVKVLDYARWRGPARSCRGRRTRRGRGSRNSGSCWMSLSPRHRRPYRRAIRTGAGMPAPSRSREGRTPAVTIGQCLDSSESYSKPLTAGVDEL